MYNDFLKWQHIATKHKQYAHADMSPLSNQKDQGKFVR